MQTNFRTIKEMTAEAKELKAEIQGLNDKIVSLEGEEKRRLELLEDKESAYEMQAEPSINSRRAVLLRDRDEASGELASVREILSRAVSSRRRKKQELSEIENVLDADKNLQKAQKEMSSTWACLETARKSHRQVESMRDEACKLLEEANANQERFLDQAILDEVKAGKQLPSTKKKHQELIDEIDMQERRIKSLEAKIESKAREARDSDKAYQEALSAFQCAQMCLQERKCIVALEKVAPIVHRFVAASRIAGLGRSNITLSMDSERLEKEMDALRVQEIESRKAG
ncbi:MAG: hypothetical protein C9356_02575 [Oleiphilus sp.]|nr:MAG: hypothetical protein C9356_02575 [Oleiphilus sp.]